MSRTGQLVVTQRQPDAASIVFVLEGNLYGDQEGYAFQDAIRAAVAGGRRIVVADLAHVERIDSCGIGILVAGLVSANNGGARFGIAGASERLLGMLRAMFVLDAMPNGPTADGVLARLTAVRD